MDSILTIEDDREANIKPYNSFIEELCFVADMILCSEDSEFIEAKNGCYIHYKFNNVEYVSYFGKTIDNYFYFGATRVAEIKDDTVNIIIEEPSTILLN